MTSGLEPSKGARTKGEQRAWKVTAMLVESSTRSEDSILVVVGPLEFSTNWLKDTAKRHGMCSHPVTLECQLVRAWREAARNAGVLGKSGIGKGDT